MEMIAVMETLSFVPRKINCHTACTASSCLIRFAASGCLLCFEEFHGKEALTGIWNKEEKSRAFLKNYHSFIIIFKNVVSSMHPTLQKEFNLCPADF